MQSGMFKSGFMRAHSDLALQFAKIYAKSEDDSAVHMLEEVEN